MSEQTTPQSPVLVVHPGHGVAAPERKKLTREEKRALRESWTRDAKPHLFKVVDLASDEYEFVQANTQAHAVLVSKLARNSHTPELIMPVTATTADLYQYNRDLEAKLRALGL